MRQLPSLKALRAFDAVARLRSVSAAAAELAVTPSAVSRQISNLEEDIGIALVKRDGRRMLLTEDGRRLESGLAEAFTQIVGAVDRLRQSSPANRLRIRVPSMLASAWLVSRLDRFDSLTPDVDVIIIDQAEQIGASVHADMVIDWGRFEDDAGTVVERLTESEEVFPMCSPDLCPDGSLAGAPLLHLETVGNPWSWPDWPEFLEAVGLDSSGADEGPHLAAGLVIDAAIQGKGVMLTNNTMAHDHLAAGRLVRPIGESMATDDSYWLLTARTERHRPEVVAFRNWLVDELAACFGRRRGG